MKYGYYYTISMYFAQSGRWETLVDKEVMNCANAHRAIALLNILYVNDMLEHIDNYRDYETRDITIKWSVFRVPLDEDGTWLYADKRYSYSIASSKRVRAKRCITLDDILK